MARRKMEKKRPPEHNRIEPVTVADSLHKPD